MPLQHKHAMHLHLASAAVLGRSHSLLPSSRRGICGICFPGEAQAKQSHCRTPQRIWFPSPRCKNLLLLSNTLLQIRSGLQSFRLATLRIQPWLTMENAPGFSPPKSAFAGQNPPPAPLDAEGGFLLALPSASPPAPPPRPPAPWLRAVSLPGSPCPAHQVQSWRATGFWAPHPRVAKQLGLQLLWEQGKGRGG